jgi:DNA-binding transcriptional LysR family regulator
MDIRQLRYFIAVAEELNFTRAAERLHMAQPPLSMQIRSLEDEIGAQLFIRDKRRVYLTPAGQELLGRARAVLDATAQAKTAARHAAQGVIGRLALGYTASSMFTERLPGAIRHYIGEHPHVDLSLREMASLDQLYALHERELDVGILRKPDLSPPDGVTIEAWYRAPLVAAIPKDHALAGRAGIRIKDLRDEPLITYPRDAGIGLYWPVIQLCADAGFRPHIAREAREPSVMIGLVSAGIGIAVVPHDTQCIRLEGVAYQRILNSDAVSTLYLAHRAADANDHVKGLLAVLRAKRQVARGSASQRL